MSMPKEDGVIKKEPREIRKVLLALFKRVQMEDLPAMSAHVQELIRVTNSSRSTASEITEAILRDYSLTNKILQVANSAYYSRGVPIGTISRAVTVIGFDTVRELATAIALLDDLVKTSEDKEQISIVLTQSFLSAMMVKLLCKRKNMPVQSEDAFICGLLHNLGKIIVYIYLPRTFHEIMQLVEEGKTEALAARLMLDELTFFSIGRAIAEEWNFSETITAVMIESPRRPKNDQDTEAILQNMVVFCNLFVTALTNRMDYIETVNTFKKVLDIDLKQAVKLFEKSVEQSEDTSETIRYGLQKLKVHDRIEQAGRQCER